MRAAALTCLIGLMACTPQNHDGTPAGALPERNRVSSLRPGPPSPHSEKLYEIEQTTATQAEGERLFSQFNCTGCHAAGGGAIGPPLIDDEWIYGSSLGNIVATILEGRPQGMPSFDGRISQDQAMSLAVYVRSLAGLTGTTAPGSAPLAAVTAESSTQTPVERGRDVFLWGPCALCHTIRGTQALATVGPDLTHLASRETLAGVLPNTRGNLAGWILNPQNLKPGTQMPPTHLSQQDLDALVAFLESLK
jgi:cytochrome c oxidase cbb3-type subunit III